MTTRAGRDAAQERYEGLLEMAETLADSLDEIGHSPAVPGRFSALAAMESASDVCSRLGSIVRAVREMPVDP